MKITDSGMPDEAYWNSLFDVESILDWLPLSPSATVVEVGVGYGTFAVPIAARLTNGSVVGLDIDSGMIDIARRNIANAGLSNIECIERDVVAQGTGIAPDSVDVVLLFNILHFTGRRLLLQDAARILKAGGIVAIMHWRTDIETPRGPAVALRPDEAEILRSAEGLNLRAHGKGRLLEPYHFGLQLAKAG